MTRFEETNTMTIRHFDQERIETFTQRLVFVANTGSQQEALAAAIAGSRLAVYPGAGHGLHRGEPERFAALTEKIVG